MKRALYLGLALGFAAGTVLGQGYGPGQQGAVLKNPFTDGTPTQPAAGPPPKGNSYVQDMWNRNVAPSANPGVNVFDPAQQQDAERHATANLHTGLSLPEDGPDPNQDILVSAKEGPWMISVASYMGPEAPRMARSLALELRNQYRLPAFVFSRGREERKKEYDRVKSLLEQQRKFYRDNNFPVPNNLRVKYRAVQEQCAVLIGNYSSIDVARREVEVVRKLTPPDPKRVQLDMQSIAVKNPKTGKIEEKEGYANPFRSAFVVHNPVRKQEDAGDPNVDIAQLRLLNRSESLSLLECKKPFTLVVKQFFTPATIQPVSVKGAGFLQNIGLGGDDGEREDVAAQNAHTLAEVFRKQANMDAFVLHTRFSSIVTVGAFDSLDDPRVESTRHMLTTQLGVPQAIPMRVPR